MYASQRVLAEIYEPSREGKQYFTCISDATPDMHDLSRLPRVSSGENASPSSSERFNPGEQRDNDTHLSSDHFSRAFSRENSREIPETRCNDRVEFVISRRRSLSIREYIVSKPPGDYRNR